MRTALVLVLSVVLAAPALGAQPLVDYTVTSWTEKDGLPSPRIWSITQDADGYLWLGTDAGLVRFDGVRFASWQAVSETTLPPGEVMALCSARDGSLWVGFGGYGGVGRVRDRQVTIYGEPHGIASGFVTVLLEDQNGTIWAGGLRGLYRFDGERWHKVGSRHGLPEGPTNAVYHDGDGTLWIANPAGVFRRIDGKDTFQQIGALPVFDRALGEATIENSTLTIAQLLVPGRFKLLHDRRRNIWLATLGHGLWLARNVEAGNSPRFENISTESGLSSEAVRWLFEDREGNIWVGTQAGLHQFSPRKVMTLTTLGLVRAVAAARDGSTWIGTNDGLIQLSGTTQNVYRFREGFPGSRVTALYSDEGGSLWIATERGVARFVDGAFVPLPLPEGNPLHMISAITTDAQGNLWLSDMDRGLFRWRDGRLTPFDRVPAERRTTMYSAYTDNHGRVWFGFTDGKVGVLQHDGTFQVPEPGTGLRGSVTVIYEDRRSAIWVGASDGLSRFQNGRWVTVTERNGLPGHSVSAIVEDEEDQIWVGVGSGILRLDWRELDKVAADPLHNIDYRLYDTPDGLVGMPLRLGTPSGIRAGDGRLWFVTGSGAAVVDPRSLRDSQAPPPVRIEELSVDARRVAAVPGLRLPAGSSQLQIDYTALTFTSPMKVRFRYRLEGFDAGWIDAGTRRQAFYTNLPPRSYRFHVIASNKDGAWNRAGAVLDFSIKPMVYQTGWFYVFCATTAGLTVWAAWRLRLRQVRREFSMVLAERARMSREIHDTLLQSLVGVALQFDLVADSVASSPPSVTERLGRIRSELRAHIREARTAIRDLRSPRLEQRDLAAALREAGARITENRPVRFDFSLTGTPRPCPPKVDEQLLRIGQEAITNAVRHAEATEVLVELRYEESAVRVRVSDNGRGFDARRAVDEAESHYGLASMKERAEEVGGEFQLVSSPGKGTEIFAKVPIAFTLGKGENGARLP